MKRVFSIVFLLALYTVLLIMMTGCSRDRDVAGSTNHDAARPQVAVEVAAAESGSLIEGVEVTGTLAPKFEVDVKSEIAGLVQEVYVNEWVRVKKGKSLAQIDTREQEAIVKRADAALESAKASQLQAQVASNRARRELERMKQLVEEGLVTQQAFDDAQTEAEAASSRVEAARAQVRVAEEELHQSKTRLSKGLITAPIDGIVSMRQVNVGDLVGETGANKPLFHIVDNRILNLTVSVPSSEMARLHLGQSLRFTTDALPGRTFTGKVMFMNPAVNEADRSVKVIVEVRNILEELKGGLFVRGRIITGTREGIVQVPRAALLGWDVTGKKAKLYVVEGGLARLREVKTGLVAQERVEVAEGLGPGEVYIVRGAFNVKDGDRVIVAGKQGS
jgi:RND family efflux transporter MFP subunit